MKVVKVGFCFFFLLLAIFLVGIYFDEEDGADLIIQVTKQESKINRSEAENNNIKPHENTATSTTLMSPNAESTIGAILHSLPAEVIKTVRRGKKAKPVQKNQSDSPSDSER